VAGTLKTVRLRKKCTFSWKVTFGSHSTRWEQAGVGQVVLQALHRRASSAGVEGAHRSSSFTRGTLLRSA